LVFRHNVCPCKNRLSGLIVHCSIRKQQQTGYAITFAGEVLQYLMEQSYHMERLLDPDTNLTRNLAEIHAAPHWLWVALVKQMIESGWTVQVTRDKVGAFKEVADPGR
jgi:hypothetical protein